MKTKYTKELLEIVVAANKSYSGVLRELGLKVTGGNHRTIQQKIKAYEIDTSHFTGTRWNKGLTASEHPSIEQYKKAITTTDTVEEAQRFSNTEDFKLLELNRDEWRFKLFTEGEPSWAKYKFTKERENKVTEKLNELFDYAVKQLLPIIISNTNLNKKDHEYWKAKAESVGYDFEVKYFPVTLSEALKRDKKRGGLSVGQDVIFDQWQKWLAIVEARKYKPNEFKPKAIILDIDGTIALTNGRSHYDYSEAVFTDKPRLDVIEMVSAYASITNSVIICVSGREDICKQHTLNWLETHCIDYERLHMRRSGDTRCDTIVKEEIFWNEIEPYYNVVAAFDDRPKIVRHWKFLGIPLVVDVSLGVKDF